MRCVIRRVLLTAAALSLLGGLALATGAGLTVQERAHTGQVATDNPGPNTVVTGP